jgi:hypothetical protein
MFVAAAVAQDNVAEQTKKTLYDIDDSILFPAIKSFAMVPGTKADIQWMQLDESKGKGYLFKEIPDDWYTWKDEDWKGRTIAIDQNGFRVIIQLQTVPDVEKALTDHIQHGRGYRSIVLNDQLFTADGRRVSRVVKYENLKGHAHVTEYRYFESEKGAICVELTVFEFDKTDRTLDQLVTHLRLYYGKYEGVCRLVEDTLNSEK